MIRRRFILLVAVWALPLIAACQTSSQTDPTHDSISLSAAKQVTAQFQGQSFAIPPRTVEDILQILNEANVSNLTKINALRFVANQRPPTTTDPETLWKFFRKRGLSAKLIGRTQQAIKDFEKALLEVRKTRRNSLEANEPNPRGELRSLAGSHRDTGNYAKALEFSKEEERLTSKTEATGRLISVYSYHADILANLGFLQEADAALKKARPYVDDSVDWNRNLEWQPVTVSQYPRSQGQVERSRGQYKVALDRFREAERILRKDIATGNRSQSSEVTQGINLWDARYALLSKTLSDISQTLLQIGRNVEAEANSREAVQISLRQFGRYGTTTLFAVTGLSRILARMGRHEDARLLNNEVIKSYDKIGAERDTYTYLEVRRSTADSLVAEGEMTDAVAIYDAIFAQADSTIAQRLRKESVMWAVARISVGQSAKAIDHLEAVLRDRTRIYGATHLRTAEARGLIGAVRVHLGNDNDAARDFRSSVPALLDAPDGTVRTFILEAYLAFLSSRASITDDRKVRTAVAAFQIANGLRSSKVNKALSSHVVRGAVRDKNLANLVRREQDAHQRIEALYNLLNNSLLGESIPTVVQDLREKIHILETASKTLNKEIRSKFPDYANLADPTPATIDDVQNSLAAGEAMIATYVSNDQSYIWAIPKSGKVQFTSAPLGKEKIIDIVGELREALDPQATTLGKIPTFNVALSHQLYQSLLAPVRDGWKNAKNLLVVGHRGLAQLPFSVLVTKPHALAKEKEGDALFSNYKDVPWLVRTHTVTVLPSASALASFRAVPTSKNRRRAFIGFGDPYFSAKQAANAAATKPVQVASAPGDFNARSRPVRLRSAPNTRAINSADLGVLPRLPDTADEVTSIAKALKANFKRDVYLGTRATEDQVKTANLSTYKVLAFATHGLVPGDLDGLDQPALALSSPKLGGTTGDGLLTMGEILGLRLDADWVVLSACNTAAAEGEGAEAFSGLGRAFFYAGTRAMLLSNWPVETTSARLLTTDLFKRQASDPTLSRAYALQQSMQTLMNGPGYIDSKSNKVVFSYAHPIFWAPFSLVGDGGGGKPAS
jgi:CHAT domain-containing protein